MQISQYFKPVTVPGDARGRGTPLRPADLRVLPNGPVSIITHMLSLDCNSSLIMNKISSFPNQQQSMTKKFVKEGPGTHKEMDATKAIISVLMLPFEGYCQKRLSFECNF